MTPDSVTDGEYSVAGWNRYMYCAGNPVVYKDPSGHDANISKGLQDYQKDPDEFMARVEGLFKRFVNNQIDGVLDTAKANYDGNPKVEETVKNLKNKLHLKASDNAKKHLNSYKSAQDTTDAVEFGLFIYGLAEAAPTAIKNIGQALKKGTEAAKGLKHIKIGKINKIKLPSKNKTIIRRITKPKSIQEKVIQVTPDGIALAPGKSIIPSELHQSPYRSGSYGKIDSQTGKYNEVLRIDPPTQPGYKGPNYSHFHKNGGKEHLTDLSKWPGGKNE